MKKLLITILLLVSLKMVSQNFQGKIYDDEAIVSGVKVVNKTQNILSYSDSLGNFSIEAAVNDSISFRSLFHLEKIILLKKIDFEGIMIIELKKAVNDLDEVLIIKEPDFKPFDPVEANATVKNQILEDIKRNPQLYSKASNGSMDFVAIAKLIGKLFKSKKPKEPGISFATYEQLVTLFETNSYFSLKFLKTELKIEEDYTYLFIQFCEAKSIDSKLLLPDNRFLLLDTFLKCSNEFSDLLKDDQKDGDKN